MAIELGTGYVSIVPSARGFARNLAGEIAGPLERAGSDAGDRSARSFGRTFAAGMGAAATKGAIALGGGFTLAAGFAIKVAADFEQTSIAFEGILGSADKAKTVLGDLRDFAAKTPFEFTGLADSAKALLGVGFAADDILPVMGTLGDVAAALGAGEVEIKGVVRALGQIKGKGKVSAEELQQISEQLPGFSAIGAIAKSMGISTQEAFEKVGAGAVPAEEGITAILDGMTKFPGAAGAMERQSKTLNGVISTFKDTLATTAIDFITPYLPAISAGVAAFGGFIQDTAVPALQSFIDFISNDIAPGIEKLLGVFREEGIGGLFREIGLFIQEQAPILGQQLLELGQKLVDWIGPQVGPALAALGGWLGDVVAWILDPGVEILANGVRELLPPLVDWIVDEALPAAVAALGEFLDGFSQWVIDEGVPAMIEAGKDLGAALGSALLDGLKDSAFNIFSEGDIDAEIKARFGEKREDGGRVRRGAPYIVGEKRPELFIPNQSGTILPEVPTWTSGGGSFISGDLVVQQLPGEDAGDAIYRTHRKIRMMAPA